MDKLDDADSLTKEIMRLGKGSSFRPNTTGELDLKAAMKLSKRSHNPDSYADSNSNSGSHTRPHAPLQSRRGNGPPSVTESGGIEGGHHLTPTRAAREQRRSGGGGGSQRKPRKKKSDSSLVDKWEGLRRFSKVNSSRSLRGEVRSMWP